MTVRILAALAAAACAMALPASAQPGPDPAFCASIKSIMSAAPKGKWPEEAGQTLSWDGGSSTCTTSVDGKTLTCDFFRTQLASGDQCKLFRAPEDEEITREAAARIYARERAFPAVNACFAGASASQWQVQEASRVTEGIHVTLPDQPALRFGESNAQLNLGDNLCVFNAIGFEIDALP